MFDGRANVCDSVTINKRNMVVTCSHLPNAESVSLAKSSKHSVTNPQSTNIAIKCTVCKRSFWSYHFAKHWEKEHSRTKGNIPPATEMKLTISQDEKDYFKRGQVAKKKRRAAAGHGSSGSKGAKKQKKGKGKGKGKGKSK